MTKKGQQFGLKMGSFSDYRST